MIFCFFHQGPKNRKVNDRSTLCLPKSCRGCHKAGITFMQDFLGFWKENNLECTFLRMPIVFPGIAWTFSGFCRMNMAFLIMQRQFSNHDKTKMKQSSQGHWLVRFPSPLLRKCKINKWYKVECRYKGGTAAGIIVSRSYLQNNDLYQKVLGTLRD